MKNIQELEEALAVRQGIVPQTVSVGTEDGASVDTRDFDTMLIIVAVGTVTATGTVDITVQESSDDAVGDAFANITGAVFTQITVANDNTVYVGRIKCKSFERFIRAQAVVGADTGDFGISYVLAKFDGLAPVTQTNAAAFTLDYISDGGTVGSEAT